MISIQNEYSPVNPPRLRDIFPSYIENSDNDLLLNSTLPSKTDFDIYGVWAADGYYSYNYKWVPNTEVCIANPAVTTEGMGVINRPLMTPEKPEILITEPSAIVFRGFASKNTVEQYLEETFMPDGEFSPYYDLLTEQWGEDISEYITDEDGNFSFDKDKYSESDFPYELLFECPCDYTPDANNEITYIADGDVFAIYERKQYIYTFYYPTGELFEQESVYYGESPSDPIEWSEKELPSEVMKRYKLTSETVEGNVMWTATEDSTSETGDFIYSRGGVDRGAPWSENTSQTEEAVRLSDYTAGTPNQATDFKMRAVMSVPVIFVIDGYAEGYAGSYGANGGVKQSTGHYLSNYRDFYNYDTNIPIMFVPSNNQTVYQDASLPVVYRATSGEEPAKDNSIHWFYDPACYSERLDNDGISYTTQNNEPIILYTKLADTWKVSFSGVENGSLTIRSDLLVVRYSRYSYEDGEINYKNPVIIGNSIYVPNHIRLSDEALTYTEVRSSTILVSDRTLSKGSWSSNPESSTGTWRFYVDSDMVLTPIPEEVNKPKVRIAIDSTITPNFSSLDTANYSYSVNSEYVEITAIGAGASSLSTQWVYSLPNNLFSKSESVTYTLRYTFEGYNFCDQSISYNPTYTYTGTNPSQLSCLAGDIITATPVFEVSGGTGSGINLAATDSTISEQYYPALCWDAKGTYDPEVSAILNEYEQAPVSSEISLKALRNSQSNGVGAKYRVKSSEEFRDITTPLDLGSYSAEYYESKIILIETSYYADGHALNALLHTAWQNETGDTSPAIYWAYAPDGTEDTSTAQPLVINDSNFTTNGNFDLSDNANYLAYEKSEVTFYSGYSSVWTKKPSSATSIEYGYGTREVQAFTIGCGSSDADYVAPDSTVFALNNIGLITQSNNYGGEPILYDKNDVRGENSAPYYYRTYGVKRTAYHPSTFGAGIAEAVYNERWFWLDHFNNTAKTTGSFTVAYGETHSIWLYFGVRLRRVSFGTNGLEKVYLDGYTDNGVYVNGEEYSITNYSSSVWDGYDQKNYVNTGYYAISDGDTVEDKIRNLPEPYASRTGFIWYSANQATLLALYTPK